MPLQATSGAASYDAFGGGVAAVPQYIEDVFSTYLYTGNGSTQTITNGIDLSGKGGLVWTKQRSGSAYAHNWIDTVRGRNKVIFSNSTIAEQTSPGAGDDLTSFNANGFSIGANYFCAINLNNETYASWTFRKQPKFFDIVTWTGDGTESRVLSHNLGSTPGCIIVKRTDSTSNWFTFHRSATENLLLNTTTAGVGGLFYIASANSTTFTLGTNTTSNATGGTYVAYLFAHNAGGFGTSGSDNVISCGSFTTDGSGKATVNLGYEPQWLLMKNADGTNYNWVLMDTMRRWTANTASSEASLYPNTSDAEAVQSFGSPTATGFNASGWYAGQTIIYIAIRRGPMKVPTSGTSVYNAVSRTGTSANATVTGASFAPDITVIAGQSNSSGKTWVDKLRGPNKALLSAYTNAEQTTTDWVTGFTNTGFTLGADASGADYVNKSPKTYINWMFGRAPSFFDEVCYTGNGTTLTVSHNLGVAPQLMIVKARSIASQNWFTYSETLGNNYALRLDQNYGIDVLGTFPYWNNTTPTSTNFVVNNSGNPQVTNGSGVTYVAYLFATCPGVSKVGSYTGTGALQTVNCGFTSGARFVLIKRTDSTGDWYTYDSTRGITSGNDPYLFLNTTDPEDTGTNYVDTDTTGFKVTAAAPAGLNASGGTYIFLAIA